MTLHHEIYTLQSVYRNKLSIEQEYNTHVVNTLTADLSDKIYIRTHIILVNIT